MNTSEKSMTPEQSFQIINDMIGRARNNYNDSISFYLLLWGVIMVISPWLDFVLIKQGVEWHAWSWVVLASLGVVIGIFYGVNLGKKEMSTSLIDKAIMYIWISCAVSFFIMFVLLFTGGLRGPEFFFISGIGCFASGMLLKFKPLIIGGVVFWVIAPLFYILPEEWVGQNWRILMTTGLLLGYVLPGILLRRALKND